MTTLFATTGTLSPSDAKSVRSFPFEVPAGTEALSLVFEWDPDHSDDVEKNRAMVESAIRSWGRWEQMREHPDVKRNITRQLTLLNTVLVEPSGRWRGRSDRGKGTKTDPLVVDPNEPASGFVGGPIEPGRWSIDLEVHSVVTDACNFTLEIKSVPSKKQNASASASASDPEKRATATKPGWYRGELHSHTRHSDGSHRVDELVRRAEELGLDFLCLTDHNTTSGGVELRAQPFPTVLGAELTTFRGHHVVLGLDEMVPWHRDGNVLDPTTVARAIRKQGALFTLTHPFNLGDPICTGCRFTSSLDVAEVDLVEIWHRRWIGDSADNLAARELWNDMWKRGLRPVAVGVRDWHNKNHEASLPGPLPTTVVYSQSLEQRDLLAGLKRGAVYITRGPTLDVTMITMNGTHVKLGESAPATSIVIVEVVVDCVDRDLLSDARVQLHKNGELALMHALVDGRAKFVTGGAGFYRIEVWRDDGPLVLANHIVLD